MVNKLKWRLTVMYAFWAYNFKLGKNGVCELFEESRYYIPLQTKMCIASSPLYNLMWFVNESSIKDWVPTGLEKSSLSDKFLSVQIGHTVVLPCEFEYPDPGNPPPHVIEWSRFGNTLPIYIKIGSYPARINSHFKGRMFLLKNSASLRIHEVRLSDEGWYVCRIFYLTKNAETNDDVISNGTRIKLIVTARPTITSAPPSTFVTKENDSLLLRCAIEGKPEPEITWRKDDWLLISGKDGFSINGGHLSVTSIQKKHRGSYTCIGRNSEGQVEYTTRVYVKASPELIVAPNNLTLKEDVEAYFNCKASGYPKNITYSWYYDGVTIKDVASLANRYSIMRDGTLVIYNVNRYDSGSVTCMASNGYGDPTKETAYLTVQYRARPLGMPSLAYGGLSLPVTLLCPSEGEPPINVVTWRKNGKVIGSKSESRVKTTSEGSLFINNMLRYDEGSYTCTPYNILGSSGESNPLQLVAKHPPAFALRPPEELEAEIGKPLKLRCTGVGDPKPHFSWRKAGSDFANIVAHQRLFWHGGNLTIRSVMKEDHGRWECVMTNPVTEMISNVQLNVKYTTPHVITNVTLVMSHNSASLSWLPGYDGGYPQHFMIWFKRADQGDHMWSTRSVNRSRTRAIVNRLKPETVYQFAVLAENVLGSGKFSKTITAKTQALPTETPAVQRSRPPAPYGLKVCLNGQGILVLSWDFPNSIIEDDLLGFLVEFRVSDDEKDAASNNDKCNSSNRSKRQTLPNSRLKRSADFVDTQDAFTGGEQNIVSTWNTLSAYPANTSRVEIDSEKLLQNRYYELHVLVVTPLAYSPPSKSIYVDTTGLLFYSLPLSSEANAAVLSGIISGVIFMLITFMIAIRFCFNRRKDHREATAAKWKKSSPHHNIGSEVMKSCSQSSNATSHTAATSSNYAIDDGAVIKKKKGVFQKLKSKFDKTRQDSANYEQQLVGPCYLKGPNATVTESPARKLGPIYRSPDGKFHVSDSKNSYKVDQNFGRKEVTICSKQDCYTPHAELHGQNTMRNKSRPVSDSFLHQEAVGLCKPIGSNYSEPSPFDENAADASLEIDCSQSDIEVRFIAVSRNISSDDRTTSPFQTPCSASQQLLRHASDKNSPLHVKSDPKIGKYAVASYISDPSFLPRLSVASPSQCIRPFSPFLPPADYVFLKDLGISCADTPMSDITYPTCYDPAIMLSHNATPTGPPRYKYHSHALVPGGQYHVSPRASNAAPSTGFWVGFKSTRTPPSQIQKPVHSQQISHDLFALEASTKNLTSNSSNKVHFIKNSSRKTNDFKIKPRPVSPSPQNIKTPPPVAALPKQKCDESDSQRLDFEPSSHDKSYFTNRSFRSHSWSLPSLAHRRLINSQEKQKQLGKRFASTEDVLIKSDTDSDRGFSFTSGSASTVRFVASKDSNLTLTGDENQVIHQGLFGSSAEYHPSKHSNQSPNLLKSFRNSNLSETGGGSCSGYESQYTSSETSSNCLKSRAQSNNDRVSLQEVNKCLLQSNNNPSKHGSDSLQTYHHLHLPTHYSSSTGTTGTSTASSDESRSRKDNSSVDDKYEWDSEFAMESEILEALKNFESHNREKPVSNKLQNLRVNRPDMASSSLNPAASLLVNNVFNESENEDECVLTPPTDPSYSKEKMEKRCADLKREYLEYKRMAASQQQQYSPSSRQSH